MDDKDATEFGRVAVALGFLTRDDRDRILRTQQELVGVGVQKRLGELLLEHKILSREQVLLILRAQGKRILVCRGCRKSFNIHHYKPSEEYSCKYCRKPLTRPSKPATPSSSIKVQDSIRLDSTELRGETKLRGKNIAGDLANLLTGYEIVKRLGQGGMGSVYKARDAIMNRWVAVKILAPFLATDMEYVKRFFLEARIMQKLHHPYIVRPFDAGVVGDHKYLIMEFVNGPTLDRVLRKRGRLPERAALELVRQVAVALDYAWQRKIIHRDIKPLNIMLTRELKVKLCDLGLSKDVTQDISLTTTGSISCSPPYASPELAQGYRDLDCRSDVYSLGVTLFQILTGELPFKGSAPGEFLIKHVTKSPPNPREKNPAISKLTSNLILTMLEKKPEDRPTPEQVARALRKITRNGKPAQSRSASR